MKLTRRFWPCLPPSGALRSSHRLHSNMVGRRSRSPTNRQQTRQVPDSSSADTAKFPQTFRFSNRKAFSGESSPSSTESSTAGMSVPITAGMGAALALLAVHCTRCPSTQRLRWLLMLPKPTAPNPGSQNGLRECPTPQTAPGGLIPFPVVGVGADVPLGRVPGAGWLRRSDHKFRAEPSGASGRRQVLPAHTPGAHALSRRGRRKTHPWLRGPGGSSSSSAPARAFRHGYSRSHRRLPTPTPAARSRPARSQRRGQPAPHGAEPLSSAPLPGHPRPLARAAGPHSQPPLAAPRPSTAPSDRAGSLRLAPSASPCRTDLAAQRHLPDRRGGAADPAAAGGSTEPLRARAGRSTGWDGGGRWAGRPLGGAAVGRGAREARADGSAWGSAQRAPFCERGAHLVLAGCPSRALATGRTRIFSRYRD